MTDIENVVFHDGSDENTVCLRSYAHWDIVAEAPDDEEGYAALEEYMERDHLETVGWD